MNSELLRCVVGVALLLGAIAPSHSGDIPKSLKKILITSSLDGSSQPSLVWTPPGATPGPRPVLVFLHQWSANYEFDDAQWQREAMDRNWIYLHPDFRGRNDSPHACGSELAQQDVLDVVDWVSRNHNVDRQRIYLAGVSGGGHMAMLLAGRHPERWTAVSAWVGISDLSDWYRFHLKAGVPDHYARMLANCCGGAPGDSPAVDEQFRQRSPIHWLKQAGSLPIDLNAGVTDGKTGSVPIRQTLQAFNEIAAANGGRVVAVAEIQELVDHGRLLSPVPSDTAAQPADEREIRLRRTAGASRVTIFDGGHEGLPGPACAWLSEQVRPQREASAR